VTVCTVYLLTLKYHAISSTVCLYAHCYLCIFGVVIDVLNLLAY
jgi:hypothetical protein